MKPPTEREREILELFRRLEARDQQAIVELMRDWLVQTKRGPAAAEPS
jgi:hypothetical protein